ncbi:MAG: hypothetical protein GVY09_12115 [Gammaproteobacteria bacterium]|jgi:hypothetical protein|nr:hypothetical protein [Gammaproteobacteria bacterium]
MTRATVIVGALLAALLAAPLSDGKTLAAAAIHAVPSPRSQSIGTSTGLPAAPVSGIASHQQTRSAG